MSKEKYLVLSMFALVVGFFFLGGVDATRDMVPYGNLLVESSVLNALNDSLDRVVVDIVFNESLPQEIINREKERILSDLSASEFFLERDFSNSPFLIGDLSKRGLEKLKLNTYIDRIIEERVGGLALDESVSLMGVDPYVWDLGYSGRYQTICVIDTGVNASHPALQGKVLAEKCYNSDNGCPGGVSESNNATDEYGHGTGVAGVLASTYPNLEGIAHGVDLYIVRVTDEDGEYSGDPFIDIDNAIDWCRNQGVDVISMSFYQDNFIRYKGVVLK